MVGLDAESGHRRPGLLLRVLGPLEGWSGEDRLSFGGQVQKRILAALLLDSGRVVPVARLAEAAWGEEPPATMAHQVRKAIADLRRRIPLGTSVIITDGAGYRANLADGHLDLHEFRARGRAANTALRDGRPADAAEELRAALDLWRGPALSGVGGPLAEAAATALEEARLTAADQLFELRLGAGESGGLVAELRTLVAEHPLRETLRGHLMLALHRCGRQAEALEEYERVRALLAERLGADPGRRLADLHTGMLRGGLAPAAEAPMLPAASEPPGERPPGKGASYGARSTAGPPAPPCTLPPALDDFAGRERERAELLGHLRDGGRSGAPGPRVVAVDGMGGVGKTSLAVHVAHLLAPEYPDGQLALDLRGFTPGEAPMASAAALDALLRALGVPAERIPDDPEGRSGLWRSVLADRRVLLVLDNAANAEQVRPLLPNSANSSVLVTGRARLLDLDGARWVFVGPLTPEGSSALMAEALSPERVRAEPEAAAELAGLCGHLPLALRLATARLRNRPRWTVRHLVERLRDENRRMGELRSAERSVAATLQLSYRTMTAPHRHAFLMLGLHPGAVFGVHSAAALLGTDTRDAEDALEALLDAHLLQQPALGLYAFHDLVRSFARDLGASSITRCAESAAVERLLGHYLAATGAACALVSPGRTSRPHGLTAHGGELPVFRDRARAMEWFEREHPGILAAVTLAERRGHDRHVLALTRDLHFLLHARGQFDALGDLARLAVLASRRTGQPALLCVALTNLGATCWRLGRFAEGLAAAEEARDLAHRLGDRRAEAHSEANRGLMLSELGRYGEALPPLERALSLAREEGAVRVEAEALTTLSALYGRWGRYPEAVTAARRALRTARAHGYPTYEIVALAELASAHLGLGAYPEAGRLLTSARELCGDGVIGPGDAALVHALSGKLAQRLGEADEARAFAGRALLLARSGGAQVRLARVGNLVAELHLDQGEYEAARTAYARACTMASAMRFRPAEAAALLGLARVARALGETAAADEHDSRATELFDLMAVPECART
ncbi:BTAD domain-containing putative transcriptional regulator [Streptomyces sp. NPDC060198]|uniref:AfsR/SARP family transcriptional regulator n=1 Tax=Streptomyces sp. NPDC060198 TaxID=3347070 RepID=UPI003652EA47